MDQRRRSSIASSGLTPFQMLKIKKIEDDIANSSTALANHKIYGAIETIEDLRIFMAHHIFCVWDFMNLIKDCFKTEIFEFPVGFTSRTERYSLNLNKIFKSVFKSNSPVAKCPFSQLETTLRNKLDDL